MEGVWRYAVGLLVVFKHVEGWWIEEGCWKRDNHLGVVGGKSTKTHSIKIFTI